MRAGHRGRGKRAWRRDALPLDEEPSTRGGACQRPPARSLSVRSRVLSTRNGMSARRIKVERELGVELEPMECPRNSARGRATCTCCAVEIGVRKPRPGRYGSRRTATRTHLTVGRGASAPGSAAEGAASVGRCAISFRKPGITIAFRGNRTSTGRPRGRRWCPGPRRRSRKTAPRRRGNCHGSAAGRAARRRGLGAHSHRAILEGLAEYRPLSGCDGRSRKGRRSPRIE